MSTIDLFSSQTFFLLLSLSIRTPYVSQHESILINDIVVETLGVRQEGADRTRCGGFSSTHAQHTGE